ncbi:MAG: hypothetical protein ACM3ZB_11445 [bacterium]|jgi:hypothetical protein
MTDSSAQRSNWQLQVNRSELARALRTVGRTGRAVANAQAILTFEGGVLNLDLAGGVAQISAVGTWPKEVRLRGDALERLAKVLPNEDPLHLRLVGDRFFAARFSIACEVRDSSHPTPVRELLPPDADLFDILLVRSRCSDQEIDAAGATKLVSDAEKLLDNLCARAAALLRMYPITAADLRALCSRHIEDGIRQFRESDRATIRQIASVWALLAPLGVEPAEIKELMDSRLRNAWRTVK